MEREHSTVRLEAEYRVAMWADRGEGGYAALWLVGADNGQWSLALDGAWANMAERQLVLEGIDEMVKAYIRSALTPTFP